jgi:type IV pilus assembly protein PilM
LTSISTVPSAPENSAGLSRLQRWLSVMPHPEPVVEIAATHVAAARWDGASLTSYAAEQLPVGAVMPSPVDTNVTQPAAVQTALRRVFSRIGELSGPVALLVPDPVVRVFILPFDTLPRRTDDALPLLRWRLKKIVPFDVEETAISYSRQKARDGSLEVVAAVARKKIVREYEEIVETLGATPTVVMSATLATLPLLSERGSTLLMRMNGRTLTTAIVRGSAMCLFRSTEMQADASSLDPKWMLEEIFPATAFYQDTWGEPIERVILTGFGDREELFQAALVSELKISAGSLENADIAQTLDSSARTLMQHGHHPLVGWMANTGANAS